MVIRGYDPSRVIGIEPSNGFLTVARTRVDDMRTEFRLGDAQSLPLEDGAADIVVSGLVLNFAPDKNQALREMLRVSWTGGTVAAYVWDYAGDMQIIRNFWDAAGSLLADARERHEGRQFPICNPEALASLFGAAGLQDIETTAIDGPAKFADFDDYWRPFLSGQGPAGAYCTSLSEADRERLRTGLKEILPVKPDGSIDLIARAWAVRGTNEERPR